MGIPGERERQLLRIPGEREGQLGRILGERGAVGENTRGRGTFTVCASYQAISTENFTGPIEFVKY